VVDDWLIKPDADRPDYGRQPTTARPGLWFTVRYRLTPWWVRVFVIYVASRVVSTALLLGFAAVQQRNAWTGAHPGYLDFAKIWDGTWYYIITVSGYPRTLPLLADGHVNQNAWAFMPGYPYLVRGLMFGTGLSFDIIAPFVSLAFGLGTALMFYQLMRKVLPNGQALFAVVLYCVAPVSPLMQLDYAESMQAFFLVLSLYLLLERRYVAMLLPVAIMALTRPSGLAFALALGLHVVYRWWTRRKDPFPVRERVLAIGATLFAVVAGFAWPAIAWFVTGSPTAYTDTELSWRAAYIGYQELLPFTAWVQGANFWITPPFGPIVLVLAVIAFGAFMFSRSVKKLGPDIRFWTASYVVYLLAVFFPQSSTFRVLMPTFPILGALAQPKSKAYRVGLVLVFIVLQWGWLHIAWWVDGYDWTPP
jgi:hypothetical protein